MKDHYWTNWVIAFIGAIIIDILYFIISKELSGILFIVVLLNLLILFEVQDIKMELIKHGKRKK